MQARFSQFWDMIRLPKSKFIWQNSNKHYSFIRAFVARGFCLITYFPEPSPVVQHKKENACLDRSKPKQVPGRLRESKHQNSKD